MKMIVFLSILVLSCLGSFRRSHKVKGGEIDHTYLNIWDEKDQIFKHPIRISASDDGTVTIFLEDEIKYSCVYDFTKKTLECEEEVMVSIVNENFYKEIEKVKSTVNLVTKPIPTKHDSLIQCRSEHPNSVMQAEWEEVRKEGQDLVASKYPELRQPLPKDISKLTKNLDKDLEGIISKHPKLEDYINSNLPNEACIELKQYANDLIKENTNPNAYQEKTHRPKKIQAHNVDTVINIDNFISNNYSSDTESSQDVNKEVPFGDAQPHTVHNTYISNNAVPIQDVHPGSNPVGNEATTSVSNNTHDLGKSLSAFCHSLTHRSCSTVNKKKVLLLILLVITILTPLIGLGIFLHDYILEHHFLR
jgi:hypothetical protein